MRGADDRAEIMRVLNAIENNMHASAGNGFFERRESFGGSERDHSLMLRRAHHSAIQHFPRLKSHRNAAFARQLEDLLDARSGGSFGDQDTIERTPGS